VFGELRMLHRVDESLDKGKKLREMEGNNLILA
jgi:hypothetical protein